MKLIKIKKALISVSDKTNLKEVLECLKSNNVEIISTGGSYKFIKNLGFKCTEISEYTKFPEILDGRLKTLHPKIHGGLLAKADDKEHQNQIKKEGINFINILIVNLYPFEKKLLEKADFDTMIENIDIGGPAMIRSSAKNFKFTTVISSIDQYSDLINELNNNKGSTSFEFRKKLATDAFLETAYYDSVISNWMNDLRDNKFPKKITIAGQLKDKLRYGENPHQQASVYKINYKNNFLSKIKQIQGKELSYNNYLDMYSAVSISKELGEKDSSCVIVKHNNPCGCAIAKNALKSYELALNSDPISAFGGIVSFNREVNEKLASEIIKTFYEVIIARGFNKKSLEILKKKKNLRLISLEEFKEQDKFSYTFLGDNFLIQDKDKIEINKKGLKFVTKKKPTDKELEDLIFAFKICKFVKSNAIVIAKNNRTLGIGAGQTNRLASSKIACQNATEFLKDEVQGSVAASDAFFPFADGLNELIKIGIKCIIQPGGSIKDGEVIAAANKAGVAMVFTGIRNFKH
ncbi:MAG: bifunctional phosphoribosylaminoimidazolecarboxamide formyltransferase/IMP cyclohydrolase [Candidatus Fonsibacter sp.]|nr:bifunctional phosphoribosylaminoimidazolecarboxamide formyltransferase/IMP cyclohydrolase [Candidatus Fonsibacter sp.]